MKKLLALALTLCLLLGVVSIASAAEPTTLTMWTFIPQHQEFFEKAAERWNNENPDRPIKVEVTTIGYDDMHNKFKVALQSDEGAPDMCDVELGQFPNILAYSDKLVDLTPVLAPYMADLVKARLEIYAKDGKYYGAPLHVGAMVCFYDKALLEEAGIDYTTIKTWDDWKAAGIQPEELAGSRHLRSLPRRPARHRGRQSLHRQQQDRLRHHALLVHEPLHRRNRRKLQGPLCGCPLPRV